MEMEEERKSILKRLEEKQTASAREADEAEEKNKGVCKILDQVRAGQCTIRAEMHTHLKGMCTFVKTVQESILRKKVGGNKFEG